MPDQEAYEQQLRILQAYRQTLAHLLEQAAKHGGISYAPVATANAIRDTRQEITQIKNTIRGLGFEVSDSPIDNTRATPVVQPERNSGRVDHWHITIGTVADPQPQAVNQNVSRTIEQEADTPKPVATKQDTLFQILKDIFISPKKRRLRIKQLWRLLPKPVRWITACFGIYIVLAMIYIIYYMAAYSKEPNVEYAPYLFVTSIIITILCARANKL